jgi:hypothetical protein
LVLVSGFSLGKFYYKFPSLTIKSTPNKRLHADILNSVFYLVLLLLGIIAVSRSGSWGQTSIFSCAKRNSIFPEGEYTLQFTLKRLNKVVPKTGSDDGDMRGRADSGDEQQHLIDT